MIEIINAYTPSLITTLPSTDKGLIIALKPVIKPILQIMEPITTPKLIPWCPIKKAYTATIISGILSIIETRIDAIAI